MPRQPSQDEQVAQLVLSRIQAEAKAIAAMRGLPDGLSYATPDEELELFDQWDDAVDPGPLLLERIAAHRANGVPDDAALAESILEVAAVGFKNRLKMAQAGGRLTLSEQQRYLERMAQKSRERRTRVLETLAPEVAAAEEGRL